MKNPIAVKTLTNIFSIAVLAIDEEEEKIISCFYNMDKQEGTRRTKIFYDAEGAPYFKRYGVKHYLNEFLRIWIKKHIKKLKQKRKL